MSILRKPLDQIVLADLEQLVASEARETNELEFKGALPFKPQKGQPEKHDRWVEKGDRVGELARDEILEELVAFANAEGGTLVLGLHETREQPRRAERLEPLPSVTQLARRFQDAAEDLVEPRLPILEARPIVTMHDGAGYVVFRVARSALGPHRVKSTKSFPIRRGERCQEMTTREIRDLTLQLARSGDLVTERFSQRSQVQLDTFAKITSKPAGIAPPLPPPNATSIRVTSMPVTPLSIPKLTTRPELWWRGDQLDCKLREKPYDASFPFRYFGELPRTRLRAFEADILVDDVPSSRIVTDAGLIEFQLLNLRRRIDDDRIARPTIWAGWVFGLLAGTLAQIDHLRSKLAWDGVEFGLEIELLGEGEPEFQIGSIGFGMELSWRTRLPLYSVQGPESFNELASQVLLDILNAGGKNLDWPVKLTWNTL